MKGLMMDYPLTITQFFERSRRLFAKKTLATRIPSQPLFRYTYAEFAERVRRLAGGLRALDIRPGDRVGTFMWNCHQHLEAYWAIPMMGAVLHTVNFRLAPPDIAYIVTHGGDTILIVGASVWPLLEPMRRELTTVREIVIVRDTADARLPVGGLEYEDLLRRGAPVAEWPQLDERDAAAMCYTSGTTGHPKGVVYSHRALYLHPLGMAQVTVVGAVPTVWIGVKEICEREGHDISSIRLIPCGGSAAPRSLIELFDEKFGVPMLHAWGMTETTPVGTLSRLKSYMEPWPDDQKYTVRAKQGFPSVCVDLRIVDEQGRVAPWDGKTMGEIQVRGPWVTSGYYKADSADHFTEDGWFKTGDVGTIDPEGYIQITDRTKDVIKSGGEWISSVDLENLIMAHPKVLEAAVVAVPHPKWIERPLACVVPKPEHHGSLTAGEIIEFLRPQVARFWLPDDVVLIEAVPKTSVGKFDKKVLRERFKGWPPKAG